MDQIRKVVIGTHGLGLIYRILDVAGIFRILGEHFFGGQTCRVKFIIGDSFLPENSGSTVIHFTAGRPTVVGEGGVWDVEVTMDVAEFSSMLVGAAEFSSLHNYSLAHISDERYLETIDRLFRAPKPICLTAF